MTHRPLGGRENDDDTLHPVCLDFSRKRTGQLGISIAAQRTATGAARTMALYACARSLALFVASVVPFLSGSVGWLLAVAWSMIIVQALDAIVGMTIKDKVKTFGPAATALLNLAAVIWLIQST